MSNLPELLLGIYVTLDEAMEQAEVAEARLSEVEKERESHRGNAAENFRRLIEVEKMLEPLEKALRRIEQVRIDNIANTYFPRDKAMTLDYIGHIARAGLAGLTLPNWRR